jgi:pyruvate/2-oxoglutarate dehydrogenase complex dihydrolipoamide dehydrogenase (E3) component
MYGKKVAVVEADPYLGGTCVNVGAKPYLLSLSFLVEPLS